MRMVLWVYRVATGERVQSCLQRTRREQELASVGIKIVYL
jgi:hypothetical protein